MEPLKVYISGPLSDGGTLSRNTQWMNLSVAVDAFVKLAEHGFAPLCPHLTLIVECLHPGRIEHDQWLQIDYPWLASADLVLRLPGTSAGADREVREAQDRGIRVVYSVEEAIRARVERE